ncbi:hypothetical protein BD410DRAFT_681058, partial [Rickenella mellea]
LDEILAFIYTGPVKPPENEYSQMPLLVKRNKVAAALEWLKLNHADYSDLIISQENLMSYDENSPPVVVDFRYTKTNKNPESTAVNDDEEEIGVDDGQCPFTVHGLTGAELETMDINALKAAAINYLDKGGKMLAIGHHRDPLSIYHNRQLYPSMF